MIEVNPSLGFQEDRLWCHHVFFNQMTAGRPVTGNEMNQCKEIIIKLQECLKQLKANGVFLGKKGFS